jgi:hypothetical protein
MAALRKNILKLRLNSTTFFAGEFVVLVGDMFIFGNIKSLGQNFSFKGGKGMPRHAQITPAWYGLRPDVDQPE